MSLGNKRVVQLGHSFKNKRGLHNHLLVLLHSETKVSIMDIIHRISKLDHHSLKEVWHSDIVGIMHVISLLDST